MSNFPPFNENLTIFSFFWNPDLTISPFFTPNFRPGDKKVKFGEILVNFFFSPENGAKMTRKASLGGGGSEIMGEITEKSGKVPKKGGKWEKSKKWVKPAGKLKVLGVLGHFEARRGLFEPQTGFLAGLTLRGAFSSPNREFQEFREFRGISGNFAARRGRWDPPRGPRGAGNDVRRQLPVVSAGPRGQVGVFFIQFLRIN